jgi:hypothetical protein
VAVPRQVVLNLLWVAVAAGDGVIADSPEGLEAARRAGMAPVDVRPYLAKSA